MTGSGKTTIARLLAKKLPRTAVIGMDKVKRYISDFERGERDNTIARDVVFEMTKTYFEHNISVIVEQPFKNNEEIKKYERLAVKYKLNCYKFQLFSSPEIAYARVVNRQQDLKDKCPKERIKRNISLFKKNNNMGFVVIDTSNLGEKKVSNLIFKEIKQQ